MEKIEPSGWVVGPTLIKGVSFLNKNGNWIYHEAIKPILIGLPDDEWIEKYGDDTWKEFLKNKNNGEN